MVGNPGSRVAQKHGPQGAEKQYYGNGIWEQGQQEHLPALGLGVEDEQPWLVRGTRYAVSSGQVGRHYEGMGRSTGGKVGGLLGFGGCGTSNCRRLGDERLGSQELGQRQGGPRHGGKNGALAKGWLDYLGY